MFRDKIKIKVKDNPFPQTKTSDCSTRLMERIHSLASFRVTSDSNPSALYKLHYQAGAKLHLLGWPEFGIMGNGVNSMLNFDPTMWYYTHTNTYIHSVTLLMQHHMHMNPRIASWSFTYITFCKNWIFKKPDLNQLSKDKQQAGATCYCLQQFILLHCNIHIYSNKIKFTMVCWGFA